ncbi:MAG: hypothetical protein M1833_000111 [Piccolia ochrophora]|nr:MAG: hypothetical protein M1833_000111 [Piccolia ochrophora]
MVLRRIIVRGIKALHQKELSEEPSLERESQKPVLTSRGPLGLTSAHRPAKFSVLKYVKVCTKQTTYQATEPSKTHPRGKCEPFLGLASALTLQRLPSPAVSAIRAAAEQACSSGLLSQPFPSLLITPSMLPGDVIEEENDKDTVTSMTLASDKGDSHRVDKSSVQESMTIVEHERIVAAIELNHNHEQQNLKDEQEDAIKWMKIEAEKEHEKVKATLRHVTQMKNKYLERAKELQTQLRSTEECLSAAITETMETSQRLLDEQASRAEPTSGIATTSGSATSRMQALEHELGQMMEASVTTVPQVGTHHGLEIQHNGEAGNEDPQNQSRDTPWWEYLDSGDNAFQTAISEFAKQGAKRLDSLEAEKERLKREKLTALAKVDRLGEVIELKDSKIRQIIETKDESIRRLEDERSSRETELFTLRTRLCDAEGKSHDHVGEIRLLQEERIALKEQSCGQEEIVKRLQEDNAELREARHTTIEGLKAQPSDDELVKALAENVNALINDNQRLEGSTDIVEREAQEARRSVVLWREQYLELQAEQATIQAEYVQQREVATQEGAKNIALTADHQEQLELAIGLQTTKDANEAELVSLREQLGLARDQLNEGAVNGQADKEAIISYQRGLKHKAQELKQQLDEVVQAYYQEQHQHHQLMEDRDLAHQSNYSLEGTVAVLREQLAKVEQSSNELTALKKQLKEVEDAHEQSDQLALKHHEELGDLLEEKDRAIAMLKRQRSAFSNGLERQIPLSQASSESIVLVDAQGNVGLEV